MKGKKWVLGFILLVAAGIAGYMAICFRANARGYFTKQLSLPYYYRVDYARAIKAQYLLDHRDDYDAVILGGSKSGAIDTDLMTQYSGLRYYNMYMNLGNYKDYLDFTRFLVQRVGIKEITLVLSSYEVTEYDRADKGDCYQTPALVNGTKFDQVKEFLKWMMVDVKTLRNTIKKRPARDIATADALVDGRRNLIREIYKYSQDPDAFAAKGMGQYNEKLKTLFSGVKGNWDEVTKCLNALREMKQLCESSGVTMKVVIGASMMTERWRYEGSTYYDYLNQLVQIAGEVWDFSSFNDVNMNRYNLLDPNHYSQEVADLMVRTMYGAQQYEGFGIRLTKENIFDYLAERRSDFQHLKEEFDETGTVAMGDIEDSGYLPWRTQWVSSKEGAQVLGDAWEAFMQKKDEVAFSDLNDEDLS